MKTFMIPAILAIFTALPCSGYAEDTTRSEPLSTAGIQAEAENSAAAMIADLYNMTAARNTDVATELQRQMSAVIANKKEVDEAAAYSFLLEDLPEVQVDRIAISDVRRQLNVPSISQVKAGVADEIVMNPKDDFLREWRLMRSGDRWIVGRPDEPQSFIDVRSGMILGAYGRIKSIWDSQDDFYLTLESGDRILGASQL